MGNIETASVETFAEPAYLGYAMKVVKDRAIPDIQDGMKPVQRRILYSMQQLRLLPQNAKPMKSARVVGNVIGLYHPHGDSSVYEAMVRMSQDFKLRYPLVHGEGNFGSRDGDSAAAMRYTECRLAPIAAALLDELAWDTVDYKPNYDNTSSEPKTLPARLPFALLNGASGVAVGMATNLVSHNLNEVVEAVKLIINKKKVTLDNILEVLPGPDFATGGKIISSKEEIRKMYDEGRGTLRVRSNWHFENYGKGNKDWRLVITELPPDTSTAKIMIAINDLIDPKPVEKRGKKQPLKPEQVRLKKLFSDLIDEVVDASDRNNPVNLIIEPKNKNVDKDLLTMSLCAYTDIEMNVSPNFVCVDLNGAPKQAGLLEWLTQWCDYRVETVRRRLTDEKKRVDHRLHILAGRISILDKIEQVIKVLKSSKDPKQDLMDKFKLDEIQAEDVLEMRLRQLANLEKIKLLDEQKKLLAEQNRLANLLSDDKSLRKLITSELNQDAKKFGDDRRTVLAYDEAAVTKNNIEEKAISSLAPDPIGVVLTQRGWIAWRPVKTIEEAFEVDYKIKSGDSIKRVYFGDRADNLLLVSQRGRAYSLRLMDLPSKADTAPLNQFFDIEADDAFYEGVIAKPEDKFIMASSAGYGFVVEASSWINRMKAGKAFFTLGKEDTPLPPVSLNGFEDDACIVALSTDGRAVAFALNELKVLPRGKGFGLIGLANGESLSDVTIHSKDRPAVLKVKNKDVVIAQNTIDDLFGKRSSSKKGKMLHKSSANAKFKRLGGF